MLSARSLFLRLAPLRSLLQALLRPLLLLWGRRPGRRRHHPRCPRRPRVSCLVTASSVLLLSVALAAPASATSPIAQRVAVGTVPLVVATTTALPRSSWPLDAPHTVVRPFEAPATPYAAGHRGIDLDATPGQPVYALAAGTVSFAGTVVDRPLVSVTYSGAPSGVSLLSSLEPVTPSVAQGTAVAAGQQIGVVATSSHCPLPRSCLHLGVRLNGAYVSPLLLLGGLRRPVLLP